MYNTSARKQNGYIEFIHTAEAMDEIELQTGLLLEQRAVQNQEYLKLPEQVEMKKKSKQMEYGD